MVFRRRIVGFDTPTTSVWQRLQLARALSEGISVSILIYLDSVFAYRTQQQRLMLLSTVT